ncbi:MAG: hypothetical protein ACKVUT_08325 [Gaiella sp.]
MDTVLSLLELAGYVLAILLLSAAVTALVVKVLPSQSAKEQKSSDAA